VRWAAWSAAIGVVKLKKVPFKVKLFKRVAPNGDTDRLITNELTAQVAQHANDVRWQVEEFHRELKQLTGSENANAVRPALNGITLPAAVMCGFS